jgi:hypothetical protein
MIRNAPQPSRLYDLALENGCTISPFVGRIKDAIADYLDRTHPDRPAFFRTLAA